MFGNDKRMKICVIGAGPAGLMAAIHSATLGVETVVIEANTIAGRKLLLTGNGRCNFTHLACIDELVRAFGSKGKFLRHSFYQFPPESIRQFFHKRGLKSKVESDGCVFPVSDRSSDVRDILLAEAKKNGVLFLFARRVDSVTKSGQHFSVRLGEESILAQRVIIATGGLSYPDTGSSGDGYKFAQHFGHTIIEPRASLVPLVTAENWPGALAGTSLDNVRISACVDRRKIDVAGAMIFTHDGIGGPVALDLSRFVTDFLPNKKNPIDISIDLAYDISEAELEKRILKQISQHPKKSVVNILAEFVPRRLAEILCREFGIEANFIANQLKKDTRKKLLRILKAVPLKVVQTRPIAEAMVTRGGVNIAEVDPKTMESRICRGLYFAGEVLDVDGPCGGYNLQMCWSTGALASSSAAQSE